MCYIGINIASMRVELSEDRELGCLAARVVIVRVCSWFSFAGIVKGLEESLALKSEVFYFEQLSNFSISPKARAIAKGIVNFAEI